MKDEKYISPLSAADVYTSSIFAINNHRLFSRTTKDVYIRNVLQKQMTDQINNVSLQQPRICKFFTGATNTFSPRRPSLFTKNLKNKFSNII